MYARRDRLVVDTNLWISYLFGLDFGKLTNAIRLRVLLLLFSKELMEEFIEVSFRPKFSRYITIDDLEELLYFIRHFSVFVRVKSRVCVCRDPNDNFILALALDGKASHLITGDQDLLALEVFGKTRILRFKEYLAPT